MTQLHLIFLGIALVLFAAIVVYSIVLKRRNNRADSSVKHDDGSRRSTDLTAANKKWILGKSKSRPRASESTPHKGNSSKASVAKSGGSSKQKTTVANAPSFDDGLDRPVAEEKIAPVIQAGSISGESATKKYSAESEKRPENEVHDSAVSSTPRVDSTSTIVTELVARVKIPEPIEQQALLSLFRLHDFKFHRKVHLYGLNQLTDLWRDIEFELPSARFVELGVAIQLADRDGVMSKKELHDFQQMALEFSNKFDAPFEFSMEIDEALEQAQVLDQIGRRYDSMAVLNVVPRAKSGFRMADIESCARDLMMTADKKGIYVKTKGQKHNLAVLYRLACTDGSGHFGINSGTMTPVHDLVMYMNVPAIVQPDRIFQDMVKDANSLATWLD